MRLIKMELKMKMKYRSHRYEINRPRSRHERKYSNIWTSVHEKVKQHWGWVENSVDYKRSV